VTHAVVAEEMVAVTAWTRRRPGWTASLDVEQLLLTVDGVHPVTAERVRIQADLNGYRAIPPAWTFIPPAGSTSTTPFPSLAEPPVVPGSVFHSNKFICAPWNRLAHAERGGLHADWGGLANWTSAGGGSTKADTLADMIDQLHLHLSLSKGMS
jgi:hypothetical protein